MPAALDVNKEEVRMLALSLGVREAARKMGIPESTVQYWSMTGKWFAHLKPRPLEQRPASLIPRSTVSTKPADALQSVVAENKVKTKVSQSNYLAKASKALENVPDAELLSVTDAALQLATMASKVYPEEHGTGNAVVVTVNLSGKADTFEPIPMEAEWSDIPDDREITLDDDMF